MNPPPLDDDNGPSPPKNHQQQPKALRFITNHGAPHPKRRRVGAACLTCRKRKTACSGERPFCDTCNQNKLDCAGYSSEVMGAGRKRTTSDASIRRTSGGLHSVKDQLRAINTRQVKTETKADPELSHKPPSKARGQSPSAAERAHQPADVSKDAEWGQESLLAGPRNRMPYFRWLGPTAIMPGFKQMVVKVKRQDPDLARSSTEGGPFSPSRTNNLTTVDQQRVPSVYAGTPDAVESDVRTPLSLPFYDTSPMPPSELITHLANTFFTHLGCNYPFLQRERFLRDLDEKQVDAILVDAVCALAARFSTHSMLTQQPNDENKPTPAEYGHAFAQRAKTALVDTFGCPTMAAVQAALLLAYNEFGEQRDSGLWMYLGIAIRMAQDLGLHKVEGLKYKGKDGPTPKMVKRESLGGNATLNQSEKPVVESTEAGIGKEDPVDARKAIEEQKAVEQERVDTFWALFFLDRVVSSGTGRRSTIRDKDIELSFPSLDETDPKSGWPAAFPALIRTVHLYGRVADLLNTVKEPSDVTSETHQRLAAMESQVTHFYQGLSARLHFDAVNFQHYMKTGEGTNFVLLHFWFHTLIVLLHQPTLLKTFEGKVLQLFPNSQQLSMSSAKTIADILSYSQLMDAKASLGNPFTTQPMYVAACAFLKETAEQTVSSNAQSRASSPSRNTEHNHLDYSVPTPNGLLQSAIQRHLGSSNLHGKHSPTPTDRRALAKHTLLATAARQHYQLCYKALQSVETYWAGTKYIITVLDQKFEGVGDPLLYTVEEGESSMERPKPEPAFTSPGWRRKLSWGPYIGHPVSFASGGLAMQSPFFKHKALNQIPGSPSGDPTKAIGWTLTGTMNSPSTNLAWHYPSANNMQVQGQSQDLGLHRVGTDAATTSGFAPPPQQTKFGDFHGGREKGRIDHVHGLPHPQHLHARSADSQLASPRLPEFATSASTVPDTDANLLLGLGMSPYINTPSTSSTQPLPYHALASSEPGCQSNLPAGNNRMNDFNSYAGYGSGVETFSDMMIESQDVEMSMLGLDMMPWFDSYPTHDIISMFDPGGGGGGGGDATHAQGDAGLPHDSGTPRL